MSHCQHRRIVIHDRCNLTQTATVGKQITDGTASTEEDRILPLVNNRTSAKLLSKKSIRTFQCLSQEIAQLEARTTF